MSFFAQPDQPYLLEFVEKYSDGPCDHVFCGLPRVSDAWCPNCDKPMLCFLSLDTRDARLELGPVPFSTLSLVFCWTCNVAQDDFFYRVRDDGGIALLSYRQGGVQSDFPYANYPESFPPRKVSLRIPSRAERLAMEVINSNSIVGKEWRSLDRPRHQVGGIPYSFHNERDMACPRCDRQMPFLASIGDRSGTDRGFVECDFVQVLFHYCRGCRTVGVFQETD